MQKPRLYLILSMTSGSQNPTLDLHRQLIASWLSSTPKADCVVSCEYQGYVDTGTAAADPGLKADRSSHFDERMKE